MGWISHMSNKAGSMSLEEMQNNATLLFNQLTNYGWTINAISGALGNIQKESYINPAQWQIGYEIGSADAGFGLVQWTPSTKYIEWSIKKGYDINDGIYQTQCIETGENSQQYYPSSEYPLSYADYKKSTESVEYLVTVFLRNYERAGVEDLQTRIQYGLYWFEYLSGKPPIPPTPTETRHKMPLYFYLKRG